MLNDFAILSPYLVPASMPRKRVNVGDGLILRGIERQIGRFPAERVLTSREAPAADAAGRLASARAVILGGANQLNDRFNVWPGADLAQLRQSALRFIPFAIGIDGLPKKNAAFTDDARAAIEFIHDRIEYSSWRCPVTVRLLDASFPHLKGRFLMTGCPVLYDRPLLEGSAFPDRADRIAVTVTERDDFWDREATTLAKVADAFPKARKWLVLHQKFDDETPFERRFGASALARPFLSERARLRVLARKLGYDIVAPIDVDDCRAFYETIDLHVGSRLHAHLNMLSQNKRSFLTKVDERSSGFSEFLGFPLIDPAQLDSHLGFDFEIVRANARSAYETMRMFLASIERL